MDKLILNIYHGNFEALERPFDADSRENLAMSRLEDLENRITETIPAEYHALLSEYHNAFMEVVDAVAEEDFLEGYRMGVQMMIAAWPKE